MPPSTFPVAVSHSIEALPPSSPLREFYPEDLYSGGGYFPSPYGRTKYWISGPEDGQKVVLIHGISVPAIAFQKIVPALVGQGLQVLTYDIPGRGYSDAPDCAYDAQFYIVHLALLLQYVKWESANIIGYSMGGAVAVAFAATLPHLVTENVTLLASVGLLEIRELQWKYLPGAKKAFDASIGNGVVTSLRSAFETLGNTSKKRFLIIQGTADTDVPYSEAHKINKLIPQARLVLIEGASHALPWEEGTWQEVVEEIIPFVTGTSGRLSKYK
ncbi:alpha/beta-hydrolase [Irpex lacteus]|nr:alpha/beta-hydrolase [Irpex lacteus]